MDCPSGRIDLVNCGSILCPEGSFLHPRILHPPSVDVWADERMEDEEDEEAGGPLIVGPSAGLLLPHFHLQVLRPG